MGLKGVARSGRFVGMTATIFSGRADQVRHADAIGRVKDRQRPAVGRQRRPVIDVVHALELFGLPGVHLDDDPVGEVDPGLVVAHRG